MIDTAKAVADGAANPEVDMWDVWMGKASVCKAKTKFLSFLRRAVR